ncbi:MAG: HPr family phosphocarrier protein [Saccharofermentans sp.]|nr:HPr family phosphocarrier protein [Saccharofermentans sp.]
MKKFTYTIKNEIGIHVKPAGDLSRAASKYMSKIFVTKDGNSADATKILAVMSLGIGFKDKITVTAMGEDDEIAIEGMKKFFKDNF